MTTLHGDALLTTAGAALYAGVAPATIRSWANCRRRLLAPAGRDSRGRPLYRALDVLDAEREARRRDVTRRSLRRLA